MENYLFELGEVSFSYLGRFPGLNKISLKVSRGESIVILGANGSGKSTLLHLVAGLIYAQEGSFKAFDRLIGKDTFNDDDFRKYFRTRVGILFQNSDLQLFCPSVEEELYFGPLQLDLPAGQIEQNIEGLSLALDIKKLFKRSPQSISIGEKKKVAIASVLAVNPEVLLLDEPTAELDARTCTQLLDLILKYHQQGKTIITVTHDLHIAQEIADSIYILNEEKALACFGGCQEILSNQALLLKYNLAHIHTHRHQQMLHSHLHQHGSL